MLKRYGHRLTQQGNVPWGEIGSKEKICREAT